MIKVLRKMAKWTGIVVAVLVVLIVAAAIIIPKFLPLEKIKNIAAEKASQAIHRQVKIGKVSFNIFTGIMLNDLSVSNRPGYSKEPFVSCKNIELKYDLWKLLKGNVYIDKVVLIRPEILVESIDGVSNYADLVGAKKPAAKPAKETKTKEPISLLVSNFSIVDGKLTMNTTAKGKKQVLQLKDLNVKVFGISLVTQKPMSVYVGVTGVYEGRPVPISISGKVDLDMTKSYARVRDLDVIAAGEKLSFNIIAKNFDKAPDITLNVSSPKIDTDKFLAILSGTGTKKPKTAAPPYGVQTASINKSVKSVPANIKLNATFDLNNILFKEMRISSLSGKATLVNKVLNLDLSGIKAYRGTISGKIMANLNESGIAYTVSGLAGKGFDATSASNDFIESFLTKMPDYKELKSKLFGDLSFGLTLTGRGVETPDIIANAKGNGSFALLNGKLGKMKSLSSVGEKIGLKLLQGDIALKEFKSNFSIANKIVTIKGLTLNNGDAGDIKLGFDGSANIGTLEFIKGNTLSLKLNPRSTQLASEYEPFKDEKGWYSLDFEMLGSLKKPIPMPKMGKAIDQMIKNKSKELENAAQKQIDAKKKEAQDAAQKAIDAKKKEAQNAAQKAIDEKKKEAEAKAKQELEQKAKDLLKF
jgi:hypothetical protein